MKRTLQNFGRIIISQNVGSSLKFAPFLPQPLPASILPLNRIFHSSIVFNRRNSDDNNAKIIDAADWHNVQQVSVVNMSSKHGQPGCYGIFWGEDDPMNIIQKCSPTRSNVFFSSIDGVLLALRQAVHERKLDKIIVRTESDYLIKCATSYLQFWRNNGYKKRDGGDVKNKDELKDLDTMLSQINARFEKIQSPFEVFQKLKNVSNSDVNLEVFAADSDTYDPASTEKTIFVHSAYIEKPTAVNGQPFKIAAYGIRFKGNESLDIKDRMGKFPSHLRAQMYGILKALEVAKMDGLKNVQIVCDSPIFLKYYKKGWKKNDGGNVANHPLYIEILKLADELNASFRYLPPESDNSDFQAAALLAEDGLGMPVTDVKGYQAGNQSGDRNDKTGLFIKDFYAKYTEELANTAEEWKDVPKIHAVKCKLNPDSQKYGYAIFDQSSDNDGTCYSEKSYIVVGILKLLNPLLKKKIQEGTTRLVLRTDVHPLPLFLKHHVKTWEKKGYFTAQGTPVKYADLYKEFSKLMEKIDLRIEYFKDPEEELDSKALDYCKEQVEKSENSRAID
jgi:ribonuclease HI